MAYIETRKTKDGKIMCRAQIRLKGFPSQTASFQRRTDAKKWAQATEATMREGRHFKTAEAKKHTLADMIDRYLRDELPRKSDTSQYNQKIHLNWWKEQIGTYLLADITPALIAECRDRLSNGNRKPRAEKTRPEDRSGPARSRRAGNGR